MSAPSCRDNGVGLAAPQVGVNIRMMVFNEAGVKGKGEVRPARRPVFGQQAIVTVSDKQA